MFDLSLRVSFANEAIYEHNKPRCKFANSLFKVVDCRTRLCSFAMTNCRHYERTIVSVVISFPNKVISVGRDAHLTIFMMTIKTKLTF